MSQGQHINDRKVAGAIYALKDCHMCNLNPQIGAFPRCVGIYLTNDIWNCRRKKHFRTGNKNPATTKRQPCERKPHPAIFHKHHNNAPGTLSTMTELLTHPDCLKKHQQLKLEKAKVILLAPSGALIAIPTYYWPSTNTTTTPLFQITPVLNTGLSLSEPLQLYKGYNAI